MTAWRLWLRELCYTDFTPTARWSSVCWLNQNNQGFCTLPGCSPGPFCSAVYPLCFYSLHYVRFGNKLPMCVYVPIFIPSGILVKSLCLFPFLSSALFIFPLVLVNLSTHLQSVGLHLDRHTQASQFIHIFQSAVCFPLFSNRFQASLKYKKTLNSIVHLITLKIVFCSWILLVLCLSGSQFTLSVLLMKGSGLLFTLCGV